MCWRNSVLLKYLQVSFDGAAAFTLHIRLFPVLAGPWDSWRRRRSGRILLLLVLHFLFFLDNWVT